MTHRYRRRPDVPLTAEEREQLFNAIGAEEEFEAAEWWIMGVPEPADPPPTAEWDDELWEDYPYGVLCPHGRTPDDECEECEDDLPF